MNTFKKDLACNISLIVVLAFTVCHLVLISLNLFSVTNFNLYEDFNYLVAYLFIIFSLALYIFGFFITKIKGLAFPAWLRIMFYFAFFVFTNTFYILGWHQNIIALAFMFAYLGFCIGVVSLSVFYNAQKDDKNRLKSSKKFILTSVFFYSVGASSLLVLIITAIKAFFFPEYVMTDILVFVVEMCSMLLVIIALTIAFSLSLDKSKTFINSCLVKYVPISSARKSVKEK